MKESVTYFSIIRYVPDPVREEQINIGIIAIDATQPYGRARFLTRWERVRRFGGEEIEFIKEFVRDVEHRLPKQPALFKDTLLGTEELEKLASNWKNSIQFSAPKVSTLPVEQLVDREFKRFVDSVSHRITERREKNSVIQSAKKALILALENRFKQTDIGKQVIRTKETIEGKLDTYRFDIALKNGRVYLAAPAISFKIQELSALQKEVDATAWAISDVKQKMSALEFAVLVSPPERQKRSAFEYYGRAKNIFNALKVPVIEQSDVSNWAETAIKKLPTSVVELTQ